MNAYDIEIEYDQENDNYYAEHEFSYPSKRVRLNIDTDNSLWPTDESNSMTITIPSNPQTDTNNTWDDTTKTLTLTNLDQNTLITNNQNPTFNYATDLNINLSNYQSTNTNKINIKSASNDDIASAIPLTSFTKVNNPISISIPGNRALICFTLTANNKFYQIIYLGNNSSTSRQITVYGNSYYYILNKGYYNLYLYDENNSEAIIMYDLNNSDTTGTEVFLPVSILNLMVN